MPESQSAEAHKQSHESAKQLAFEKQSRICVQTSAVKPSLAPSSEDSRKCFNVAPLRFVLQGTPVFLLYLKQQNAKHTPGSGRQAHTHTHTHCCSQKELIEHHDSCDLYECVCLRLYSLCVCVCVYLCKTQKDTKTIKQNKDAIYDCGMSFSTT